MADPQDRQQAISIIADRLMEAAPGHTRQEAEDVAAGLVDQAIAEREGQDNASS